MASFGEEPEDDDVIDSDSEEDDISGANEGKDSSAAPHRRISSAATAPGVTNRRPNLRAGAIGSSQALSTGVGTITAGAAERDRAARAAWHRFTSLNICLLPVLHRYVVVLMLAPFTCPRPSQCFHTHYGLVHNLQHVHFA